MALSLTNDNQRVCHLVDTESDAQPTEP